MDIEGLNRKMESLSGQIEGMPLVVVPTAMLVQDKEKLRWVIQELLDSQRALLLSQPVSEQFLAGLDLAGETMLQILQQDKS